MARRLMRVLWIKSDFVWPPDTGGKIRSYQLMRELAQLCELEYLCLDSPIPEGHEPPEEAFLRDATRVPFVPEAKDDWRFYARVAGGVASSLPYVVQKYRSHEIPRRQREWLARGGDAPAALLCDFLEMAENVAWELDCAKLLFQHNVESDIWRGYFDNERNPAKRAYFGFEWQRMKRYERSACNRFDHVFTVTAEDEATLRDDLGVDVPLDVLEAGVDTDFFAPSARDAIVPGRLVFLGSLDWMPNIDGLQWFVDEIFPAVRRQHPEATLDIVGRRPVPAVRALDARPGIRVIPDVPDVRPHVAAAELFVVPLRIGGGSRIKIYEAMAMDRAVVSTTLGAQGLRLRAGEHVELADRADAQAACIGALLGDPARRGRIAAAGHAFVRAECDWRGVALRLHERCVQAAARRGRS